MTNTIHGSTFHGPVIQAGQATVTLLPPGPPGRRFRLWHGAVAVVLASALAFGTHVALSTDHGVPGVTARYLLEQADPPVHTVLPRAARANEIPAEAAGCSGSRTWAHRQGGMDYGTSRLAVTAVGGVGRSVVIDSVRAEIVGAPRDPEPGTVLACRGQGEGDWTELGIDLDSPDPAALIAGSDGVSYAPYFRNKYLYLESLKPELIGLTVLATDHSYDYVLVVEGSVDGKRHSWRLQDDGRPFRISGVRKERANTLHSMVLGWATSYDTDFGAGERCNPCHEAGEVLPGTEVKGAPKPATGWPRTPPPPPPAGTAPVLVVDRRDPESVATAWAVTRSSFDQALGDPGPDGGIARAVPYLVPALAASPASARPGRAEAATGAEDVQSHRARSVVASAFVYPDRPDPHPTGQLDEPVVRLTASVWGAYYAEDGWTAPLAAGASGSIVWNLVLSRQSDGSYLISAIT
ncbi:hypothetical protein [Streptomyces sp. TLI_053]|uniref:hypothetical protein n=1 Tax=Streptomyces sp. TLI_053 TaxID=1855352 RepID=UPI0013520F90|nr:hypothetical protein [Streptomyces sp. TLI_053]